MGRRQLNISFNWKMSLWRGSPARELGPTATKIFGINIGGASGKVPGRSLGGKMFCGSLRMMFLGN
jgi:hypothetical protein